MGYDRLGNTGEVTPFQAMTTALAATVGTGNIAGVTGAIAVGGPGAVFWMWLSALFALSTILSWSLYGTRSCEFLLGLSGVVIKLTKEHVAKEPLKK